MFEKLPMQNVTFPFFLTYLLFFTRHIIMITSNKV